MKINFLTSSCMWSFTNNKLYTSYIAQVYFSPNFFTKYILIFNIWMDNWRMVYANLEHVVQKEKCGMNGMIWDSKEVK